MSTVRPNFHPGFNTELFENVLETKVIWKRLCAFVRWGQKKNWKQNFSKTMASCHWNTNPTLPVIVGFVQQVLPRNVDGVLISVVQRVQRNDKNFRLFHWDLINQVVCCFSSYRLWQGFGKFSLRTKTDSNYCCEL